MLSEPELLERHLPCGWGAILEMAGTMVLFLYKQYKAAYPMLLLLEDGKNGGRRSN